MTKEVIVKRNKYGIKLILDNHIPFPELLQLITDKFKETGNFFKDAQMALSFEGRVLTPDEQLRIIETITENTSIRIACIVDDDSALEERMRTQLEAAEYAGMPQAVTAEETSTDFYKGNLRSGQVLESYSNITLIGDVNPGAKIISHGSIVILGSLKGNACAGAAGAGNCFIFALEISLSSADRRSGRQKARTKKRTPAHSGKRRMPPVLTLPSWPPPKTGIYVSNRL